MPDTTQPNDAAEQDSQAISEASTSAPTTSDVDTTEPPSSLLAVEGEYYFDGPLFIFTAAYHLRRGYCCGNDCRHCPYDPEGNPVPGKGQ